jgi:ribonuclease HI
MSIHCDASFNKDGASIGVYIPNVCSKFKKIEAKDSGHAERMAILYAMRIAAKNGLVDSVVYSDSKSTVDKVRKDGNGGSKTIKRIKYMMRRWGYKLRWKRRSTHKIKIADKISRGLNLPNHKL